MTLYDLLGALPDDDAEGLRTAFRRAVKGAHPDISPGDPDAAWKFRRIVRAHEILGDAEQRAAYDHLLDLAQQEEVSAGKHAAAARIHRLADGVIAVAGILVATLGASLLLMHMSGATVAPPDGMTPAMHASASVDPAPPPVTTGSSTPVVKDESASIAAAIEPVIAIASNDAEPTAAADAGPTPEIAAGDIRLPRARGASAHRHGNLKSAIGDQASLFDPTMTPAPTDRGVMFYRLRKFDRAFADIAPAKSVERPGRARPAPTTGTPRLVRAAIPRQVMPLPRRRPAALDPSQQESVALARLR